LRPRTTLLAVLAVIAMAACSDAASETPESMIEEARAALAQHLLVGVDRIAVVEAKPVMWSDGSMGCARPGVVYPQGQVEGHLIILGMDGGFAHYHQGGDDPPFLCQTPTE
jgi:hypothetical protein